jgi:transposase
VIDYATYCHIHALHRDRGLRATQIAQELNLHPDTVARWLREPTFKPRTSTRRPSKLDPYKGHIVRWLERHPYSAAQLLDRLRPQGYDGGYTILKEYVRQVRPPTREGFLTLHFEPGECAQVDWGHAGMVHVGNTRRRLSFFVMVLCYSRMLYVEFTLAQTMEQFLGCHQNAFEYFGGSVRRVMVDNLKSAVLSHPAGQPAVLNPRYLDFAHHHGFDISACTVGAAHEKGRVENGVRYVKTNFLHGMELDGFAPLNPAVRHWLDTVANVRIHGQTRERPLDRFEQERGVLRPLPAAPYDIGVNRQVSATSQFRVVLDTNRYSVPAQYARQRLTLRAYPDRLLIYHQHRLIAEHIRRIVALGEIYGPEPLADALLDALELHAFSAEYIANLLEQRARRLPEPGALHLTRREDLLDLDLPEPDLSIYDPQ